MRTASGRGSAPVLMRFGSVRFFLTSKFLLLLFGVKTKTAPIVLGAVLFCGSMKKDASRRPPAVVFACDYSFERTQSNIYGIPRQYQSRPNFVPKTSQFRPIEG